jgi:hypothetical protein
MFQMISGMNEACYTYSNLLDRVKKNLIYENEGFNQAYRLIIKSPKMIKDGSKKNNLFKFRRNLEKIR